MPERIVVIAEAYFDAACTRPLPRLIGPFDSREFAENYMRSHGRLWGSWGCTNMFQPDAGAIALAMRSSPISGTTEQTGA